MSVLSSFAIDGERVRRIPTPVEAVLLVANINPHDVVTHMSIQAGMSPHRVRGTDRHRDVTNVRRAIARALRDLGLSYPEIGRALGGRCHATAMHLVGWRRRAERAS